MQITKQPYVQPIAELIELSMHDVLLNSGVEDTDSNWGELKPLDPTFD